MKEKHLTIPFTVMLIAGTLIPICAIEYYSLFNDSRQFTLEYFENAAFEMKFKAVAISLGLAVASTIICLLLAYPLAMILANRKGNNKSVIIYLFVLPMWMNGLLRIMAWQVILERGGPLDKLLNLFSSDNISFEIMNTPWAVIIGMVYEFLPFMILPIYNSIIKIDKNLIEAGRDLGATGYETFKKIILPQTKQGIVSGVIMVFIPAITTFVISNILGGGKINLIGNILEHEFMVANNWHVGSAISIIMLIFIMMSLFILNRINRAK